MHNLFSPCALLTRDESKESKFQNDFEVKEMEIIIYEQDVISKDNFAWQCAFSMFMNNCYLVRNTQISYKIVML